MKQRLPLCSVFWAVQPITFVRMGPLDFASSSLFPSYSLLYPLLFFYLVYSPDTLKLNFSNAL